MRVQGRCRRRRQALPRRRDADRGCARRSSASTRQRRTRSSTRRSLRSHGGGRRRAASCCRRLRRSASAGSAERSPSRRSTSRPTSLRGRLAGLARNWGAGAGPLAILACPPGELHDLGLLVFGLVLRARGWRIAYLGANTPIEHDRRRGGRAAAGRGRARGASHREPFEAVAEEISAPGRGHAGADRRQGRRPRARHAPRSDGPRARSGARWPQRVCPDP